jgi:hypothetical protein
MKKSLYLYFHIPKCAGSTFLNHIQNNLDLHEYLEIYLGKNKSPQPSFRNRAEVDRYLVRLSGAERERIKIICGHDLYEGIHRHFPNQSSRYITFLRNPVERTVSHYNHNVDEYQAGILNQERQPILSPGGRVMSFWEWLENREEMHNHMTRAFMGPYLKDRVARDIVEAPKDYLESAVRALETFYFVGLVERFEKDAAFIFQAIGAKDFYPNQNVSTKHFSVPQSARLRARIERKCQLDMTLYEKGIKMNRMQRARLVRYWLATPYYRTDMFPGVRRRLEVLAE